MIIWRGWGILVVPIACVGVFLSLLASSLVLNGKEIDNYVGNVVIGVGLIISSVTIWYLGKWFHRRSERVMIDRETGREVNVGRSHSFFFIRMEYWSVVAFALGILCFFTK